MLSKITIEQDGTSEESLALASFGCWGPSKGLVAYCSCFRKAKELGYGSVVVLGHPEYYPKFGFKSK